MIQNIKNTKNIAFAKAHDEPSSLFAIPNLYDDFARAKKGCSLEILKKEKQLKNLKAQLPQPGSQQATVQQELQLIKTYFADLSIKLKKK